MYVRVYRESEDDVVEGRSLFRQKMIYSFLKYSLPLKKQSLKLTLVDNYFSALSFCTFHSGGILVTATVLNKHTIQQLFIITPYKISRLKAEHGDTYARRVSNYSANSCPLQIDTFFQLIIATISNSLHFQYCYERLDRQISVWGSSTKYIEN